MLVVVVALVAARRPLATLAIHAGLGAWGLTVVSAEVERLDTGGLVLANVAVGDGSTGFRRLSLTPAFSLSHWPSLALLRVEGLRLALDLAPDGQIHSHGLTSLLSQPTSGPQGDAPGLPERIEIADAVLRVTTPAGVIDITGGGSLGGARGDGGSLDFAVHPADARAEAARLAGHVRLAPDPDGLLHLVWLLEAARLALGPLTLADSHLSGDLSLAAEGLVGTARLHLGRDSALADLHLTQPLDLRLARPEAGLLTVAPARMAASLGGTAVTATLPALTLASTPQPRLTARDGSIELGEAGFALGGLALDGPPDDLRLTGVLITGTSAPLLAPLAVDASLTRDAAGVAQLAGRLGPADGPLSLTVTARHDPATGGGRADLILAPLSLAAPLNLNALAPGLGGLVKSAAGQVGLRLSGEWGAGGLRTGGELSLADLDLDLGALALVRGNGVLHLDSLWPLATRAEQHLAFAGLNLGVPLTDGRFDFALDRTGLLAISRASLGLSGGRVTLRETTVRPFELPLGFTLGVEDVDLGQLLSLAGLPGLAGQGQLSGDVPVQVTTAGVAIPEARLAAKTAGWLRYRPEVLPPILQGDDPKIRLAVSALRDMRYDQLVLLLSREAGGEARLRLAMKGRNPALRAGAPVEFNLNLEGRLDEIARSALAGWQVPDDIQRELKASSLARSGGQPPP